MLKTPCFAALSLSLPALLLSACATTPTGPQPGPVPASLTAEDLQVPEQGLTQFKVRWDGTVQSPDPATLERATWELVVDGKVVDQGEEKLGVEVPAGKAVPVALEQGNQYVRTVEELKELGERAGTLLVALRGKLHIDRLGTTDVVEFARSREIRLPRIPVPGLREVEGSRYNAENVSLRFFITISNPNPFDIELNKLEYTAAVGGKQLAEGELAKANTVNATETDVFEFDVTLDPSTYGPEVKQLIAGQSIPWKVTGTVHGDLFSRSFEAEGKVLVRASQ